MTYKGYKGTKCDYVMEQLKERIITGVYKLNEKLPNEAVLCEEFSVSRITVREAMKKLNMMGLLDIRQGKGTFVKTVDLSLFMKPLYQLIEFENVDIEAIFDAREYIERGTVSMATKKWTEEVVLCLEQILHDLKRAIEAEDINSVSYFDSEFHCRIAKCARNPILYACWEAVDEINKTCVIRLSKSLVLLDDCYGEHYRIYDAVKQQDVDKAVNAMTEHTLNSKRVLL